MSKQIEIKIASDEKDVIKISSTWNGKQIGALYDNLAQELVFERPEGFENYDLMLYFTTKGETVEENIGAANNYIITNALTQVASLKLQVVFFGDEEYRAGSTNQLTFSYAVAPEDGTVPREILNEYKQLLEDAIVDVSSEDGVLTLTKGNGETITTTVGSGNGNTIIVNGQELTFEVDENGYLYVVTKDNE